MADEKALNNIQKYEEPFKLSTILWNRLNDFKKEIHCQKACRVVAIRENNQVDVKILDKDADGNGNVVDYPIIPNVPIRQPMDSGSAFIRLPIQLGDVGTIEFFDSSVDDIITDNSYSYTYEEEWHSLSDGLFTNGFLPKDKLFTYDTTAKIVIGGKDGVSVLKLGADNNWSIVGNVSITGNLNVSGVITSLIDVVGGGKSLKTHTHGYTDNGVPSTTTAPN